MILFNVDWQEEMLVFPAVKRAVACLASAAAWACVAIAALWLVGLVVVILSASPFLPGAEAEELLALLSGLQQLALAALLPCLYLTALWCHHVLLAERGLVVTRWLLLFLQFFAFLHPVCVLYALVAGKLLLANQFILPAVLQTVLPCAFALNWFHMAAAPLRLRVSGLLFLLALMGQYIMGGSLLVLLLPALGWWPLRGLAQLAPRIVSLPPKD